MREYEVEGWNGGVRETNRLMAIDEMDAAKRFLRRHNPGKGRHLIDVTDVKTRKFSVVSMHWSSRK